MRYTTFFFDTLESAASALLAVLIDARTTESFYRFGNLSSRQILVSGLTLEGEIENISDKLDKIPGAVRYY